MTLRRSWRIILPIVVLAIVAFVVYAIVLASKVDKSLTRVQDDAASLKAAALNGDQPGIESSLDKLATDAGTAHRQTHSWVWSVGSHVPFYGKDLKGIRVASDVADELSHSGLRELVNSMTQIDNLVPRNGAVNLATIKKMQAPIAAGAKALTNAQTQLSSQDPSHYIERLKLKYREVQSEVDTAAAAMQSANVAAQVLPTMLGDDGPKHYLVIFENNAEVRGSGGLPGQVSYVTTNDGKMQLVDQVAGHTAALNTQIPLQLTTQEKKLWGANLRDYFLDANFSPDFPRSAALWRAHWEKAYGGHLDGVIALDPVTVSYLLKATGPITVDGVQLSSSNAVDYLLHQVYIDHPQAAAQDAFFHDVAATTFKEFASTKASPKALIAALLQGTNERRVFVHDFDPSVQKELAGTEVDGGLATTSTSRPQVSVAVNDLTGAKMSYYLRYNVGLTATYCNADGAQGYSGQATFSSTAPKNAGSTLPRYITGGGYYGVDPGNQYDQMTLYGPIGGTLGQVLVNGKPDPGDVRVIKDPTRPIVQVGMLLKPGQQENISWTMTGGKGQTGDTDVDVTPSIVAGSSSSVTKSACD